MSVQRKLQRLSTKMLIGYSSKWKKVAIGSLLLFFLVFSFVPLSVSAYTSPGKPTGYVNDFAHIISPQNKADLEKVLSGFEKQSSSEVAVVTVNSLGDETVETYAVKLFEEWGIGKKDKDNGVLLLVAPNERKVRIEVGYGLEGALTDAISNNIIQNIITPSFKAGDYDAGIKNGTNAILQVIKGEYVNTGNNTSGDNPYGALVYLFAFIFIWSIRIMARSKSWWLGGVLGAIAGIVIYFISGVFFIGIVSIIGLTILGLFIDFIVSRGYTRGLNSGIFPWWIGGGRGGGGFGGGGFGGFGGGGSGGGGASGSW